jgi:hypothetical protein
MGLDKVILSSVLRSAKSTTKFDVAIDDLIVKFEQACPPKNELLALIQKKNQISSGLQQLSSSLTALEKVGTSTSKLLKGLAAAVAVIKAIPLPTSVPPGVGIPVNVITIFADSLDMLSDLIKKGKGIVAVIPESVKIINDQVKNVLSRLSSLDALFTKCINEQFLEDSEEWSDIVDYSFGDNVTYEGLWYESVANSGSEGGNLNHNPSTSGFEWWEETTEANVKDKYFSDINFSLTEVGDFNDINLNQLDDAALLDRLDPNSTNPLYYKGFLITIESDPNNEFSFPSRRTKGVRTAEAIVISGQGLVNDYEQTVYNISGGYSYSSSTKVLVEELYFVIDLLPQAMSVVVDSELAASSSISTTSQERGNLPGTYWMYEDTSFDGGTVYYTKQNGDTRAITGAEWKGHRHYYGYPKDWSLIEKRSGDFLITSDLSASLEEKAQYQIDPLKLDEEELMEFSPFGAPGIDNLKQVRINYASNTLSPTSSANIKYYYQWNPPSQSWDIYTPNLEPFGVTGSISESKVNTTTNENGLPVQDTYDWNNFYYRWNFVSREMVTS